MGLDDGHEWFQDFTCSLVKLSLVRVALDQWRNHFFDNGGPVDGCAKRLRRHRVAVELAVGEIVFVIHTRLFLSQCESECCCRKEMGQLLIYIMIIRVLLNLAGAKISLCLFLCLCSGKITMMGTINDSNIQQCSTICIAHRQLQHILQCADTRARWTICSRFVFLTG